MPDRDVIDRLEAAIHTIQEMGIDVRREWLIAGVSGLCRIGNRQIIVLDQSLSPIEQIDVIQSAVTKLQRSEAA